MTLELAELTLPIGTIRIAARDGALCALAFADRWDRAATSLARRFGGVALRASDDPAGMSRRIARYLARDPSAFAGLTLDTGGTAFQRYVWQALCAIPFGATISYAELARRIGAPTAVRAVAAANGANPISIVIPCHRVIGSDGSLTGYGGGLPRKAWLLAHEGATLDLRARASDASHAR